MCWFAMCMPVFARLASLQYGETTSSPMIIIGAMHTNKSHLMHSETHSSLALVDDHHHFVFIKCKTSQLSERLT